MKPQDSVSWWVIYVVERIAGLDPAAVGGDESARLREWIEAALAEIGPDWESRVRKRLVRMLREGARPSPRLTERLTDPLGIAALRLVIADAAEAETAARKFAALAGEERHEVCRALIRLGLNLGSDPDADLVQRKLAANAAGEEVSMAVMFELDPRGLPAGLLDAEDKTKIDPVKAGAFIAAASRELADNLGTPEAGNEAFHATVIGSLVVDGHGNPAAAGFIDAVSRAWLEGIKKAPDGTPYHRIYQRVETVLREQLKQDPVTYQELAAVTRYVISRIAEIPIGHPKFENLVRVALDRYVAGDTAPDSLDLPVLDGAAGAQETELIPDNIRAAALIYGGHQYEQMMLFRTVDRIAELFVNGILPIGNDDAGRALDEYHFEAFKRLTEPERLMHFSRVLGVAGGDVAKETQVNARLDPAMLRFISGLAEYDREKRIGALFNGQGTRGLTLMLEQIRQAGRDLAANLTYFGYGATHFFAFRLTTDITRAHAILSMPQILKAYAVDTPRQVIERVSSQEFGIVPNIFQRETMARSGHALLNLVAKHCDAWRATGLNPLFGTAAEHPDIDGDDEREMIRHAQLWLAVNGYKDEQIASNAQPAESVYSPSIPVQTAQPANGQQLDRLRQMVASGQTPSMSDLQALVAGARN